MSRQPIRLRDIARLSDEPLVPLDADDLLSLPEVTDPRPLTRPAALAGDLRLLPGRLLRPGHLYV